MSVNPVRYGMIGGGHRAESYAQPQNVQLLESALEWAADRKQACRAKSS